MSRCIDADEMLEYLDLMYEHQDGKDEPYNIGILGAINYIKHKAPTIEIVRCKECKWLRYSETEDLDLYLDCDKPDGGGIPRSEEWFCADGEREGE